MRFLVRELKGDFGYFFRIGLFNFLYCIFDVRFVVLFQLLLTLRLFQKVELFVQIRGHFRVSGGGSKDRRGGIPALIVYFELLIVAMVWFIF